MTALPTKQDLFTYVARHLLVQQTRALLPEEKRHWPGAKCAYRTANGLSCAVGCLIRDEFYDPDLDNGDTGVDHPGVTQMVQQSLGRILSSEEFALLQKLQEIHDTSLPADWRDELYFLSQDEELEWQL